MVVRDPSGQAVVASKHIYNESEGVEAVKPRVGTTGAAVTPLEGPHVQLNNCHGSVGQIEEELARLRLRTQVTHEGEAYCPNPNIRDLPKEFETRVRIIQRYPEMRTVQKTEYVKEIHHEERIIRVPKTRVIMEEVEPVDRIPVVRDVPKTRIETFHGVITEEREVTEMVPVIEYMDVPRIEHVPLVIIEEVEEKISVPVVREVPTGNYCEAPAGEFINPGHFKLLGHKHRKHKPKSHSGRLLAMLTRSSSSSSSEDEDDERTFDGAAMCGPAIHRHADGSTTVNPSHSKRRNFLHRIIHH